MSLQHEGFKSEYYERVFSLPEMKNALSLYLLWNAKNGYKPESESTDIHEWYEAGILDLDTMLYHAEIQQQHILEKHVDFTIDVVINVGETQ